jgi:c-di-GMP-binding flagellar brake protein YcgR
MGDDSDRRHQARFDAAMAAYVHCGDERARSGVVLDISVTGVRLLMAKTLAIGARVSVRVMAGANEHDAWRLAGEVVRSEPWTEGLLWKRMVAVQFDRPAQQYEAQIAAIHARQAEEGLL